MYVLSSYIQAQIYYVTISRFSKNRKAFPSFYTEIGYKIKSNSYLYENPHNNINNNNV